MSFARSSVFQMDANFQAFCFILFSTHHLSPLDVGCLSKNKAYRYDNKSSHCSKAATPEECQLNCQLSALCTMFNYYTDVFNRSAVSKMEEVEVEHNCCLIYDADDADGSRVDRAGVTSGPRVCPSSTEKFNPELAAHEIEKIDCKYLSQLHL